MSDQIALRGDSESKIKGMRETLALLIEANSHHPGRKNDIEAAKKMLENNTLPDPKETSDFHDAMGLTMMDLARSNKEWHDYLQPKVLEVRTFLQQMATAPLPTFNQKMPMMRSLSGLSGLEGASSSVMSSGWGGPSSSMLAQPPQPPPPMSTAEKAEAAFGKDGLTILAEANWTPCETETDENKLTLCFERENTKTKKKKTVFVNQATSDQIQNAMKILTATVNKQDWNKKRKADCILKLTTWFTTQIDNAVERELEETRATKMQKTAKAYADCGLAEKNVACAEREETNNAVEGKFKTLTKLKLKLERLQCPQLEKMANRTHTQANQLVASVGQELYELTKPIAKIDNAEHKNKYGIDTTVAEVDIAKLDATIKEREKTLAFLEAKKEERMKVLQEVQQALEKLKKLSGT